MKRLTRFVSVLLSSLIVGSMVIILPIQNVAASVNVTQIQSMLDQKMKETGFIPGGKPPTSYSNPNQKECKGFSSELTKYLFGDYLPSTAGNNYQFVDSSTFVQVGSTLTKANGTTRAENLKNLFMQSQPGDVIQMDYTKEGKQDGVDSLHTMMIYSVTSDGIVCYHAGKSNVYFGASSGNNPLYGTNGSVLTWDKLAMYLQSNDDGISVYRSKNAERCQSPTGTGSGSCTGSGANFPTPTVSTKPDIVELTNMDSYGEDNVQWRIDRDCTLWITGSGICTEDFWYIPWDSYKSVIKKVKVVSFDPDSPIMFTRPRWMFCGLSSCTEFDLSGMDVSSASSLAGMFNGCSKVENLDLSMFDTSSCTDFRYMFYSCSKLKDVNLSSFDTSTGTDMYRMFYDCSSLQSINLSNFNTSNVGNMDGMFYGCSALTTLDLSSFNVDRCARMQYMFYACTSLKNLNVSGWDTYACTSMDDAFSFCREDLLINFGEAKLNARELVDKYNKLSNPTVICGSFLVPKDTDFGSLNEVITPTPTPTKEPTTTPSSTPTSISTNTPSNTPTNTPSNTPTNTPSNTPTTAPSELSVGDFASRCYGVALGREPDEAGFNSWVDQLNNGQACGAQVGYGFIFSGEYMNKNTDNAQFVKDLYAMFFGREADEAGFNSWVEQLYNNVSREEVFAGFANSAEFNNLCNKYGVVSGVYLVGVPNNQQGGVNCFIARLYKVCLNRLPDQGGQAGWVVKLMNGDVTGSTAAYGFVFSQEFINLNLNNSDYVSYMYRAFFGREADQDGLKYWVDKLTAGTATREDIFNGFTGSSEFANLCASYGINP